jgi:Domain of unknown function (DUF4279)
MLEDYDDNYKTCLKTYASLRIIYEELEPDKISKQLGVRPTTSCRKGELNTKKIPSRIGIWSLSTEGIIKSRDIRRHLDWLVDQLQGKESQFKAWKAQGIKTDVFCYWLSTGQGGPSISIRNMQRLSTFDLELSFDIYIGERP